jgi:hypothetical protein
MLANTLDEFIAKKKQEGSTYNWDGRKDFWLGAVDILYRDVNKWLGRYVRNGKISTGLQLKELHEEKLGPYNISQMIILIQGEKVILDPIGTLILGGRGRVDLKGKNGTVKLIYVEKSVEGIRVDATIFDGSHPMQKAKTDEDDNEEFVWKIATPPPNIKLLPLNKDSFQEILLQVIQ